MPEFIAFKIYTVLNKNLMDEQKEIVTIIMAEDERT